MKIGIISDTHGIVPAWEKAMKIFEGAEIILHAGDVLYHPPRIRWESDYDIPDLVQLINSSSIPIVFARGNCDSEVYEELLEYPVLSPYAFVQHEDLRIVVQHGHTLDADKMKMLIEKYRADIFITGHTHIPIIERVDGAIHVNPGSPSHPKLELNGIPAPSVGLIEDGKIRIVELDSGKEIMGGTI